jgi:hypothetical protein
MALSPGTRLGRYEIRAVLGAGGMGTVYRAHDTTLKRDVALKVVLEEFATDADRRRRFEREALATAALNHPNILAVHDVGTHDGTTYVVAELLEGKTLRETLSGGAFSARRAARYAAQIADGLAAAHDKGIIHRDIKPANLFVTSDDRVKILDFGLARVGNPSSPDEGATATATGLTTPGLVLGSAGYMAPEQVRGAAVDHRADIFSLGVVLYEMLAGRRAFHRDTVAGTLAAIVETDPPSSSGDGSAASQRLMRLVRRCLEKAPAQRFQSARDLAHVLADESGDEPLDAAASGSRRLKWRPIAMTALLTTAVIAVFALWVWPGLGRDTAPPAQGKVEFEVAAPDGSDRLLGPVLSNDGRRLAFITGRPGRIYIRDTAARTARPLEGTNGAAYPFFSPDGRRIAFFAGGQLKIAPVDDGALFVVCQIGEVRGGTWTDDDAIVFAEIGKGLSQVSPSAGATPTALTSLNTDEKDHRTPHALPDAAGIVFTLNYKAGGTGVGAVKTGADRHVVVLKRGSTPKYAAGQMFFVSENEELASAPFDIRSVTVTGPVVVHPERPATAFNRGAFAYTVARDGTLAYQPFIPAHRQLSIVGQDRVPKPFGKPGAYSGPRASPDGTRIAVTVQPRTDWGDVWIGDERGSFQPLTTDGVSRFPVWDSTGTRVGVESSREGHEATWIHDVGNRSARKVFTGPAYPVALLRDGGVLLGRYNIPNKPVEEISLLQPGAETAERLPLAVTRSTYGRMSSDSRWLAYTNGDSDQSEVYVTAYPPGGRAWQVSQAGSGQRLAWAKSGSDLYFLRNDGEVMVVSIGPSGPTGGPRSAGVGKFPLGGIGPGDPQYDTLPGGRFVVVRDVAESSRPQPIVVVLNRLPAASR